MVNSLICHDVSPLSILIESQVLSALAYPSPRFSFSLVSLLSIIAVSLWGWRRVEVFITLGLF